MQVADIIQKAIKEWRMAGKDRAEVTDITLNTTLTFKGSHQNKLLSSFQIKCENVDAHKLRNISEYHNSATKFPLHYNNKLLIINVDYKKTSIYNCELLLYGKVIYV